MIGIIQPLILDEFLNLQLLPWSGHRFASNTIKTKSFEKIEKFVTQRGTKYSAADTVTVADMHLFEMVDQNYLIAQKAGKKDFLASCPKVLGIWKAIKEDPRLEAYFAGPEYQLPQNNKGRTCTHKFGK